MEEKQQPDYLKEIAEHLKSIRSMMTFFTWIVVIAIVLQIFAILFG